MTDPRRGHGWWPYLAPLFTFLGLNELGGRFPDPTQGLFLALRVLVPGALFVAFFARGAYPELRRYPGGAAAAGLDVAVGLLGAALWMAPTVLLPRVAPGLWEAFPGWLRPGEDAAFDPAILGPGWVGLALGLRALGYGVVTPLIEELFVRSWLARYADVFDRPLDFRQVPLGRYTRRSFWVVLLFFTASHVPWEWPVAVLWIAGTQAWFYRRRAMAPLVVVHAASNLGILGAVLAADAVGLDLWYFV